MPIVFIPVIGVLVLGFLAFRMIQDFRKVDDKQKRKYALVFVGLIVTSVIIFFAVRYSGAPEKLYPEYYQYQPIESITR